MPQGGRQAGHWGQMPQTLTSAWQAYRLRWKRRRLLLRAVAKRGELIPVADRSADIAPDDILCFSTMRNEVARLPHFLAHYRSLGVAWFLIVDNASDDGTAEYLALQPDVSLWTTPASYKAARFGVDWLGWLMIRHGHGHWCLTVDADELLIYPHWQTRPLSALTARLDAVGQMGLGALMLDLYPEGRLSEARFKPGDNPLDTLTWFDPGPHTRQRQQPMDNLWVQGGARARVFFANDPGRAPTLNKIPLVRWNRRYAYVNSTHAMLPPHLNRLYDGPGGDALSGVLLHTKFLGIVVARSREEKARGEHFASADRYGDYYDAVIADPVLHGAASLRLEGWQQLEALGLMSRSGWT